jgi:C4-dicarboxylate-specific signal transduction histidine kinase
LLAKASDLLANGSNYDATVEAVAKLLVSSLAMWCAIDLVNDEGKIERVAVAHRQSEKADLVKLLLTKYPPRPSAQRGVYRVIESGKSIVIPHLTFEDWSARAESKEHLDLILSLGSSTYMCVPLIASGRVVGSIMLLSSERTYGDSDLQIAQRIANKISMAVDNVSMFRKMQTTIDELRATQRQLIHSTKMSAVGTVCAGIAHEVNNPLTVVALYLEYIENSLEAYGIQDESILKYSEKAKANLKRVVDIVSNVKSFSRKSDLLTQTMNVCAVVEKALALFQDQFRIQQIRVEKIGTVEQVLIVGDPSSIQQVFVNLFSNAADAIKAKHRSGGKITFEIRTFDQAVEILVSDDGVGAGPEIQDRVFEPFYTTKPVNEGTGLGLSISHGIIHRHKGEIFFDSTEGRGSCVRVRLPLAGTSWEP